MNKKVICLGSLNYDNVYTVENIVKSGETISSSDINVFCGGKGLNQAIALSKAGAYTHMAGLIGKDGTLLKNKALDNNIDVSLLESINCKSGHAIIQLDANGQNSIILYGGANQEINVDYINKVLDTTKPNDILVLQNEINMLPTIIEQAYLKNLTIVLNPSPYNNTIKKCDLNKVDILILNEIEGESLTGKHIYKDVINNIHKTYPNMKVVLTLGAKGSMYIDKDTCIEQESIKTEVVDTTGAGDTYTGYFIKSFLVDEKTIRESMRIASKAASIAVSRNGASNSIPNKEEIKE